MIIHDLRNPILSQKYAIQHTQEKLESYNKLFQTNEEFIKVSSVIEKKCQIQKMRIEQELIQLPISVGSQSINYKSMRHFDPKNQISYKSFRSSQSNIKYNKSSSDSFSFGFNKDSKDSMMSDRNMEISSKDKVSMDGSNFNNSSSINSHKISVGLSSRKQSIPFMSQQINSQR